MKNKIETDLLMGELVYKHLKGELSADEEELLQSWLSKEENSAFLLQLKNTDHLYTGMLKNQYMDLDAEYEKLQGRMKRKNNSHLLFRLMSVAALVVVALGIFFLWQEQQPQPKLPQMAEIPLPEDRTLLYTSQGNVVYLSDTVKEIYSPAPRQTLRLPAVSKPALLSAVSLKYNELATSSRGYIEMMLSDSTRVWLNASSKLRYPDVFGKDLREVYLSGEAYFEVAKHPDRPFIVHSGEIQVEVLGTHFNVKNREGEVCQTTLVEGSVQIRSGEFEPVQICPGQQAYVQHNGEIGIREVDTRYAIAWTKNHFAFRDESLFRILKELSEWYDFTFDFENVHLANLVYTAIIPRYTTVDDVLQVLVRTGDFTYTTNDKGHILINENH